MAIKRLDPENLYLDRLPLATRRAFSYLTKLELLTKSQWYLAGGTALCLQVGHRQSVDLDFFTPQKSFNVSSFEEKLLTTGVWQTTLSREKTLYGKLMKSKVSFIAYPFFRPSEQILKCGNVRILTPNDIAVMKILALSQRGRKRDFVDLYWYCLNREPLEAIIQRIWRQYPGREHNLPHILKSLTYFEDAENDPMPRLFFEADWRSIKAYFQDVAPKLVNKFLGL